METQWWCQMETFNILSMSRQGEVDDDRGGVGLLQYTKGVAGFFGSFPGTQGRVSDDFHML